MYMNVLSFFLTVHVSLNTLTSEVGRVLSDTALQGVYYEKKVCRETVARDIFNMQISLET